MTCWPISLDSFWTTDSTGKQQIMEDTSGLIHWITDLSQWSRAYLYWLGLAITGIFLTWMASPLVSLFSKRLRGVHSIIRIPLLSAVNLTLFGAILHFVPAWISGLLGLFNNMTLSPVVLILILLLGAAADRRR
ncbi:hypothetical protein CI610_00286 [invertebrate metagenome]|uniref:Uncharacterized protein n=1 Tax=invertebrate metagenome TaxID=1711999 RepID=A0A2H9TBW6_9ZZZZ